MRCARLARGDGGDGDGDGDVARSSVGPAGGQLSAGSEVCFVALRDRSVARPCFRVFFAGAIHATDKLHKLRKTHPSCVHVMVGTCYEGYRACGIDSRCRRRSAC